MISQECLRKYLLSWVGIDWLSLFLGTLRTWPFFREWLFSWLTPIFYDRQWDAVSSLWLPKRNISLGTNRRVFKSLIFRIVWLFQQLIKYHSLNLVYLIQRPYLLWPRWKCPTIELLCDSENKHQFLWLT